MRAVREQAALLGQFLHTGFLGTVRRCAVSMAVAVVLGYLIARGSPEAVDAVLDTFRQTIQDAGVVDAEGNFSVFALLMNNWRAMLISAAYGFIPFLYLPLLSMVSNGILLGVTAFYCQNNGLSMGIYLAGILPHGVFELSALVLSIACGVRLCQNMCYLVFRSDRRVPMVELLSDLLRVLLLLVMPLTALAAFIECYVTPLVMGAFL